LVRPRAGFTVVCAVGAEPPHDGFRGIDLPMFSARSASGRKCLIGMIAPTPRQGRSSLRRGERFLFQLKHATAGISRDQATDVASDGMASKSVPAAQIACITTAILRASATAARSCARTGSRTASSLLTPTFSTTAVPPEAGSSIGPGVSCPSAYATGRTAQVLISGTWYYGMPEACEFPSDKRSYSLQVWTGSSGIGVRPLEYGSSSGTTSLR
jgi:hypothetical protein